MKTFVIQAQNDRGNLIPAQQYGYSCIEAIGFQNWYQNKRVYDYVLSCDATFEASTIAPRNAPHNYLKDECIPIGSVEYVLNWLRLMGVKNVKPLNIPRELWGFVRRKICIDYCKNINGYWFLKSTQDIKSLDNGRVFFNGNGGDDKKYFLTEWVEDILSEWRVFVYDKKILGLRCYSGDEWVLPDRGFVENVVNTYEKRCYTLDVMVYPDSTIRHHSLNTNITDIVELHDFFSCGLYGFENYSDLSKMWITTIRELLYGNKSERRKY